ncbi:MAG: bifunctional nuclease family protein [Acidimicrobiales bacterium]
MVEVELVEADVDRDVGVPRMVLRELGGSRRVLTIFIGGVEMHAIQLALEGVETPRPMTHDLLRDVLTELGVTVERIVVTELRESTFFAELHLSHAGQVRVVSSRPSDAVALGVRTGTRIFVAEDVLDEAASLPADASADEVVEQFREFIDRVNPEDFAS